MPRVESPPSLHRCRPTDYWRHVGVKTLSWDVSTFPGVHHKCRRVHLYRFGTFVGSRACLVPATHLRPQMCHPVHGLPPSRHSGRCSTEGPVIHSSVSLFFPSLNGGYHILSPVDFTCPRTDRHVLLVSSYLSLIPTEGYLPPPFPEGLRH